MIKENIMKVKQVIWLNFAFMISFCFLSCLHSQKIPVNSTKQEMAEIAKKLASQAEPVPNPTDYFRITVVDE